LKKELLKTIKNNTQLKNIKNLIILATSFLLFISCGSQEPKENIDIIVSSTDAFIYNGVETKFTSSINGTITEVIFYFDGKSIESVISQPYNIKFTPNDVEPGNHKVTCIAKTSKGNSFSAETSVELKLRLGDSYQGGKIYYLDSTGKHGLIASTTDLKYSGDAGDVVRFCWGYQTVLGTSNDNGKANTLLMANNSTSTSFAAFHFKSPGYNYNGYSDWYIPSINELQLLKDNKSYVGGFSSATDWQAMYWSSSESTQTYAFILNFNVLMANYDDKAKVFKIRPIRQF